MFAGWSEEKELLNRQAQLSLSNLPNLAEAVKAYKKRAGIEAMFKDCKTGGYNDEGSQEAY